MTEQLVSFDTAKLAKEKGFDWKTLHFYTKPNSKMFGVDEKGRLYPIKNTSKKLYKCGEYAALNIKNTYYAPTQSLLAKWLRDVHNINNLYVIKTNKGWTHSFSLLIENISWEVYNTYEEALEIGLVKALKLIKI